MATAMAKQNQKREYPRRIAPQHTVNGISRTMREWAEHLDISQNALSQRVFKLGSLEAAIALGSGDRRNRSITYGGGTLGVKEWAERLGIAPTTLQARIAKHGEKTAIAMGGPLASPADDTDPGVSLDFRPFKETGAWSVLQETPEITFSDKANSA